MHSACMFPSWGACRNSRSVGSIISSGSLHNTPSYHLQGKTSNFQRLLSASCPLSQPPKQIQEFRHEFPVISLFSLPNESVIVATFACTRSTSTQQSTMYSTYQKAVETLQIARLKRRLTPHRTLPRPTRLSSSGLSPTMEANQADSRTRVDTEKIGKGRSWADVKVMWEYLGNFVHCKVQTKHKEKPKDESRNTKENE